MDSSGGLTKDGKTSIAVNTLKAEQAQLLSGGSISIAAKTAGAKSSTIAAKGDVLLSGGEFNLENNVAQGERVGLDVEHVGMTQKSKAEAFTDLAVRATLAELNDASLSAGSDLILDVGTALFDARSSLSSGNDLFLRGTDVTVDGAFLAAGQDLEYQGDKLSNINGVLYAARDQRLFASGLLLNDGGEIYAGRDILIADADGKGENVVRNLSGVISAGNEIAINAKTVENKKREFQVAERGKHISYNEWYECNKPLLGHGCDRRQLWYYVNVYEDYILKDSPSAQLLAGGDILIGAGTLENHYSTIAAGNNLVVKADNVENKDAVLQRTRTVKETMKGWDSDDDFTGEYFRSYNETYEEIGRSPSVLSANSGLYLDVTDTFNNYSDRQGISLPTDHTVGAGYPFAGSPMFHPSAAPGHHYLIETNPMFTNMGLFYGSDYFLSRIGLDQNRQQVVLLGDAFYETRLVQQEILSATGRRFLDGYSSDADQMRGLMDAAAAQAQGLELTAGVALTPDQVAALTQDIIWLVEEEHMGEKVLVPHLYLASATQADIMPGGGVQAKNVYVNAGKGIVNEGLISGESVNLASVNIENTGGLLRGGTLNLTALNDITNNSGHLKGGDITLAAGGDIVSQTLTLADQGNSAHRHVQAQAGIEATGNVTAVAGNDLAIRGSSLNAGGDVALAAGDAHLPPKKNYNENYHANLSGTVSEGHSNMVGEQTSILGSDSVNIYTEGNTHVAGAIIAALNDNLKLDTGTLSYENLVGKTTQTSTSAGINWNYSPEQKSGDTGKDVTQPEDVNIGEMETSNQSTQSQREAATQKAKEEQKKKDRQEKYRNLPEWMGALFGVMDDTQDWWNTTKKDTLYGVTPGKFAHIEQETTQTAYATIGKGEIIVRNNPGQSLDGLNRDPSQAMKTEQTADVNIDWKPAFSYADDLLSGWGWPNNITGTFNFFADPKAFLNDLQDTLAKSIPLLKRPEQKKENPTAPAAQTPASTPTPSTSGPQAAAQH